MEFVICGICYQEVLESHIEFHMAKHVGMRETLRMFSDRQDKMEHGDNQPDNLDYLMGRLDLGEIIR